MPSKIFILTFSSALSRVSLWNILGSPLTVRSWGVPIGWPKKKNWGKWRCGKLGSLVWVGVTSINNSLSNVPSYMLSLCLASNYVITKLGFIRKKCFLQNGLNTRKYKLVDWDSVCQPKDYGGLGLLDLRCMDTSLLVKWLWRLESSYGLWQRIIKETYLKDSLLVQTKKKTQWLSILERVDGGQRFIL